MAICNDGSTVCDDCQAQLFPGAPYSNGHMDMVIELWPAWMHDPGYHVCIDCLRRAHAERYLAEIKHMDALERRFRDDAGRQHDL